MEKMPEARTTKYPMLAFSGRMCSGKDYCAIKAGYHCVSIAEPLYRLASHYMGTSDKKNPEVRAFMQALGAWGRGEEGPSAAGGKTREEVFNEVRVRGAEITGLASVEWEKFGTKKEFWLSSAASVAKKMAAAGERVSITNARFPEELEELKSQGFMHVHVTCSEAARLSRASRPYNPLIDEDVTEKMAIGFNEKISESGPAALAPSLVVWSDEVARPHRDMLTVQSFARLAASFSRSPLPSPSPSATVQVRSRSVSREQSPRP